MTNGDKIALAIVAGIALAVLLFMNFYNGRQIHKVHMMLYDVKSEAMWARHNCEMARDGINLLIKMRY